MNDLINRYAEVRYNAEKKILEIKFLGFVPHEEFIKIVEHEYKLMELYHVKKCFIDLRSIPVYAMGTKEYVRDVWIPTATRFGVRYVAFIVPEAALGQSTMRKAHDTQYPADSLVMEHFKDTVEAVMWLQSVN